MEITILGCGGSGGVPLIGCHCAVCQSNNPKNKRTRASVLVEASGTNLLIDTSPDLRMQALREGIDRVDAVLYTHDHADHTHGIDDARSFNYLANKPLPVYGTKPMISELKQRFQYAFGGAGAGEHWYKPSLEPQEIGEYGQFTVGNITIRSFLQYHGKGKSTGYRLGNVAYSTDVNNLPDESLQLLEKLDVWIVDCLRYEPAPTHAHLAMTLGWIEKLKPKLSILTHMAHQIDYETLRSELPAHVVPAYDGMRVTVR